MMSAYFKPLSANLTKWSNILKQFVGCCRPLPTNCLSVFDHFVGLLLKGLTIKSKSRTIHWCGKSTKNVSPFSQNYIVNRSWLCKDSENNLGFTTVQFSSVTITNPEGFVEDDNICRNMVECIFPVSIYVFQVNNGNTRTM